MPKYENINDSLYGIQLIELYKFLPFLIDTNNNDIFQNNRCVLCNSNCDMNNHISSKKHIFNIFKLQALRKANIQQYLSRNENYINIQGRKNISISPISVSNKNIDIDSNFLCPISMEIMTEPVLAADGHTYDKKSIEQWFKTKSKSPITNLEIDTLLTPNILLYNLISEHLKKMEIT